MGGYVLISVLAVKVILIIIDHASSTADDILLEKAFFLPPALHTPYSSIFAVKKVTHETGKLAKTGHEPEWGGCRSGKTASH